MIRAGDFKNGTTYEDGGEIFQVIWFQHHKPGKGGAVVRLKIKNLNKGTTVETSMKPEVKFRPIDIIRRNKSYVYKDNSGYHFMDLETYEQEFLNADTIGDQSKYLKEEMQVIGVYIDDKFTSIEIPVNVVYEIAHTEPGVKGNTAQGAKKPATTDTGAEIQVPLFINIGDKIRVNTSTGEYVERAND